MPAGAPEFAIRGAPPSIFYRKRERLVMSVTLRLACRRELAKRGREKTEEGRMSSVEMLQFVIESACERLQDEVSYVDALVS